MQIIALLISCDEVCNAMIVLDVVGYAPQLVYPEIKNLLVSLSL